MYKFETIGTEGQTRISSSEIYAKRMLVVQTDGVGLSKIILSGSPVPKQVKYSMSGGMGILDLPIPLTDNEPVLVLYEDGTPEEVCNPPVLQDSIALPGGIVGVPYNASFVVNGDTPITPSSIVLPAGIIFNQVGNMATFSGTPTTAGTPTVSMTFTNACGTIDFSQTITIKEININWTYTNSVGAGGIFRIVINGVMKISSTVSASGILVVDIGDTVTIVTQSTLSGNALIQITGPYSNTSTQTHVNSDDFTVEAGPYDISAVSY